MQHRQRRLWCPGITILFLCLINAVQSQRYEFKHSLRPPFYLGRGGSLPFWEFGGSTVILEDYVRLTPTSQSKVGWLWNTVPVEMDSWEVHVDLQIGGGGKIGADGMGIWYVADPKQEGPVMGNKDYFTGVGVVFDSFDNDGQNDNPNIGLVVNDGSKPFEAQQDGSTLTVGKCKHLPWRDRKTKVKISYQNEWLNVLLESPYGEGTWQNCVAHQIKLEKGYYFGVTAATGYLFDNHDIFSWVTYNLDPWKQPTAESLQHAGIKQRLDSLTNQDMTQDETQPSQLNPIQQTVEQTQTLQPIQRQVQELAPMQPVQQPVQAHSQQQVMQPLQQHVQTQQQLMQPIQHSVQPTHNQVDSVATPPIQQPPDKTSHELWTGVKQLQVQMDSLQQQQAQIVASVNQLTAELRSLASARQNSGTAQPHIFADALEKLLAIVSDTKTVMADDAQILRNNLLDIKHSLSAGATGGANRELVTIVSDVSKKVANVQTALETAKREQASIVADLQANKEVLVSKIEQGSSFGFWSFFIFFQFCFGVAFFLWRKMRDDASKKFD